MGSIEEKKDGINRRSIKKSHTCGIKAEMEERISLRERVAKKIEEMGGITEVMKQLGEGGGPYFRYFAPDLKKQEWKVDEKKLLARDRWLEEWGSKSMKDKLDILEQNVYEHHMGDNFPFEGRCTSYTKKRRKRAAKKAAEIRRSAEAFMMDYKGKHCLYKKYQEMMVAKNKFFKKMKSKMVSIFSRNKDDRE